ncbi:ABC transporter ATP-binding protein [Vibrio sp. PP-XX7]
MGENGCGKSTLIQLLTGLLEPTQARAGRSKVRYVIRVLSGSTAGNHPHHQRARLFAVLPQFSDISFPFSVFDVVMMGRFVHLTGAGFRQEDREKTMTLLKQLEIEPYKDRRFSSLSGGEQRRVMIARVLNQEAPIVFLDEPNASLDIRHTLAVFSHLHRMPQTVITSVHDINLAHRYFERFLFFKHGKLIYDVPKADVSPQLLSEVYDVSVCTDTHRFSFGL